MKIGFFLLLQCITVTLFAQTLEQNAYFRMPSVVPPSPNVASIEKFDKIPVNPSTGSTSINVPLWTINCGDISWPLSLAYHSGGIKVDEIASNIGLGWAFSGEAAISRAVVGRPDEVSNGEPDYTAVTNNDWSYLYGVLDGVNDSEMDVYSYTFNGKSGKFLIKQDGSIFLIPYANLKITYNTAGFEIVDENGMIYTFNEKDTTASSIVSNPELYTSCWHLTKVLTPDKKQGIYFNYERAGTTTQISDNFTQSLGRYFDPAGPCETIPTIDLYKPSPDKNTTSSTTLFSQLTQVVFPNGYINLSYLQDRADIVNGSSAKGRLTKIEVFEQSQGRLLRKFELNHSYFGGTSGRLRLDGVKEFQTTSGPYKSYSFEYNNTIMPYVGSYAQDKWGFNNGATFNTSLLQTQSVTYNSVSYTIGNANRNVDTNAMKACVLTAVTWPTGGRTEYTYDAHSYETPYNASTTTTINTMAVGSMSQTATSTFTYPSGNTGNNRLIVDISRYDYPGVTGQPYVELVDITGGSTYYLFPNASPNYPAHAEQSILLVPGHTYEARAFVYSSVSNPVLTARIQVLWDVYTGGSLIEKGGGLRVRLVKNFTKSGSLANTDYYEYGPGVTQTPYAFINTRYKEMFYRTGLFCREACSYFYSDPCKVFNSGSIYPASTVAGAPLMYTHVTKYELDASGASNGKTIYEYDVVQDLPYVLSTTSNFVHFILNDWKNGFLSKESHYSRSGNTYKLIKKIENQYVLFKKDTTYNLSVKTPQIVLGCTVKNSSTIDLDAQYVSVPMPTGVKKLVRTIETEYDDSGSPIQTTVNTQYGASSHDLPTKVSKQNSSGITINNTLKYPIDFSSPGNVYEKMVNANIISPVIESKYLKEVPGTETLLSTVKNNYRDWKNDGLVLMPETVQSSLYSLPLENKIVFTNYNDKRQPAEVKKDMDKTMSYLYDYNDQYPVAEVSNASQANIAYTSFETQNKGNWSYTGTPAQDNSTPTGKMCYTLGTQISRSGLSATTTYLVSYWKKSGTVDVNGTTAVTGRTINGWTYYEHKVVNPASGIITVTGTSGIIDELRLYPATDVLMTTYTYDPLLGVSSTCDANNIITYYEYDDFGRLTVVRNQDKNILKKICYSYTGQPTDCATNASPVWQSTGQTRCKPCAANPIYISNILQNGEKDVNPNSYSYNEIRWLDAGTSSSCVPAPDWQNTTDPLTCKKNSLGHNTGEQLQQQRDMNPCSPSYGIATTVVVGTNLSACPLTTTPVWNNTGATRCKPCPANANYITNILQREQRDINPNSSTYNQLRWTDDPGTSSSCVIVADWQNTATAIRCKKTGIGQNTGEQEREQKDMNPCSSTYNTIRWVVTGTNTTACPVLYTTLQYANNSSAYGTIKFEGDQGTYNFTLYPNTSLSNLGQIPYGEYKVTLDLSSVSYPSYFNGTLISSGVTIINNMLISGPTKQLGISH